MTPLRCAALCILLPSAVAAPPGEDSAALVQANVASMTQGSINVQATHSLLATAQANFAKRATTEHVRARAGSLSDIVRPLKEATEFVNGKLAKVNATRRAQACGATCIISIVVDATNIAMESATAFDKNAPRCALFTLVTWWLTGLLTLTIDQNLDFAEAVHVMSQQFTSIGYGSATNTDTGIKIFHGIHGVLSQMSVARVSADAINQILAGAGDDPAQLAGALAIALAGSTFWFMLDLSENAAPGTYPNFFSPFLDALYQTMITMTTIGYGDLKPTSTWSKLITPVGLPLLTNAFSNFADATKPKGPPEDPNAAKKKLEICQCFGLEVC